MTSENDLETLALEVMELRDAARAELRELRSELKSARLVRKDLEADRRQLEKDRQRIKDFINKLFDGGLEEIANFKCEELGRLLGQESDRMKREMHDIMREIAASISGGRGERTASLHKLIKFADNGGMTPKDITTAHIEKRRTPGKRPNA